MEFGRKTRGTDRDDQDRSQKPKLSKVSLERHGIVFHDAILPINHDNENNRIFAPHVESLRRALLNFGASIHRDHEGDLKAECETYLRKLEADESNGKTRPGRTEEIKEQFTIFPPDNAYAPQSTWSGELRTTGGKAPDINEHLEAAKDAVDGMGQRENELSWMFYLHYNIFQQYRRVIRDRTQHQYVCWGLHPSHRLTGALGTCLINGVCKHFALFLCPKLTLSQENLTFVGWTTKSKRIRSFRVRNPILPMPFLYSQATTIFR
jgi:hypothetical protein